MVDKVGFDYFTAFSRNIGLLSRGELEKIRHSKVGIAGLGAAGGSTFYTLVRMGFCRFHISDIDAYELINFNRQIGARLSTIGKKKTQAMEEFVKDINPEVEITSFDEGINPDSVEEFLDGVDVVVDGIDYFSFSSRRLLYEKARTKGVPVVCSAPLGFTTSWLVFTPDSMSWEDYFCFDLAEDEVDQAILFLIGLLPNLLPIKYISLEDVRFSEKKGPSIITAVQVCSATNATEVLKIVLKRGPIYPTPFYQCFDTYLGKFVRGRLRKGNRTLSQRMKFRFVKKMLKTKMKEEGSENSHSRS